MSTVLLCLSLCLISFIGMATWPALQTVKILTQTLTQDLPALVVTQEGVYDYSSNYVFGFIPWEEIAYVCAASRHARQLNRDFPGVAVVVKNVDVLLRRKPGLMGIWIRQESEITDRRQVFIPQGRILVPVEDVVQQVKDFRTRMTL